MNKIYVVAVLIISAKRMKQKELLANQEIRVIVEILCLETNVIAIREEMVPFLDEMNLGSARHLDQRQVRFGGIRMEWHEGLKTPLRTPDDGHARIFKKLEPCG